MRVRSLDQKDSPKKEGQPTSVFLSGEPHGQRSLAGYSPWGRKRSGHDLETKHHQQHDTFKIVWSLENILNYTDFFRDKSIGTLYQCSF